MEIFDECVDFTARLTRDCLWPGWDKFCTDVGANPPLLDVFLKQKSNIRQPEPDKQVADGSRAVIDRVFVKALLCRSVGDAHGGEVVEVTRAELLKAAGKLRMAKAPGPDGIPFRELRKCVERNAVGYLNALNASFGRGEFPRAWNKAKVRLIYKEGKPKREPTSYRPLCLLNSTAKLAERVVLNRVDQFIDEHGLSSENQFAATKGRSKLDLFVKIREIADAAHGADELCIAVALDVRNAFGRIRHERILDYFRDNRFPSYLIRIIASYLRERVLVFVNEDGEDEEFRVDGVGVLQGSVLGPMLWKVGFDGILNLDLPQGVKLFACNDDIIFTVTAKTPEELTHAYHETMRQVRDFLTENQLETAGEKEAAVWLSPRQSILDLDEDEEQPLKCMKFLKVHLSSDPHHTDHVRKTLKACEVSRRKLNESLSKCTLRIPDEHATKLTKISLREELLYACQFWGVSAMQSAGNRALLSKALPEYECEILKRKRFWDERKNGKSRKRAKKIADATYSIHDN